MNDFADIAVLHPAGLAETMLATPVASVLKRTLPGSRITWITSPGLDELLLSFCPDIDEAAELSLHAGSDDKLKAVDKLKPELLVNLTGLSVAGSIVDKVASLFGGKVDKYHELVKPKAQSAGAHLVDEYLSTLDSLNPQFPESLFPTVFPDAHVEILEKRLPVNLKGGALKVVGVIPGVDEEPTKRAWIEDGWRYLMHHLSEHLKTVPVLIGSKADRKLCEQLAGQRDGQCINLAGELTLVETAALVKRLDLLIGGDCGMLHLAVAVGTPVIGLYGASSPVRTGPYGKLSMVCDQSGRCDCFAMKNCHEMLPGPGECMRTIMLEEVLAKIHGAFDLKEKPLPPSGEVENWFWKLDAGG